MNRYEAIIGHLVMGGETYPVLMCEIMTNDIITADEIIRLMGRAPEGVSLKITNTIPFYQNYELN